MNYQVIEALQLALNTKPNHGICGVLQALDLEEPSEYYELMFKCCEALGVFSGTLAMPISVRHGEPYALYSNARRKKKLWNSTTKYGAARRAVASKMIMELKHADSKRRQQWRYM